MISGLLVLSLVAPFAVHADTVKLNNGRSLEGRAVVLADGAVELYSSMGMIKVPAEKVAGVVRSETAEERVVNDLDQRKSVTADDLFELGTEAKREGAGTLANRLFSEALRVDPGHVAARRALEGDSGARPAPASREDQIAARERLERVALLQAMRARALAERRAELQRERLYAAQAASAESALWAEQTQDDVYGSDSDDHIVQRVIPIATVYPVYPLYQAAPSPGTTPQVQRQPTPSRRAPATQARTGGQRSSSFVRAAPPR